VKKTSPKACPVYYEEDAGQRSTAKMLTRNEAGRIAATVAENLSPAAAVEGHAQNPHTAIKIEALIPRRALCAYVGNATKRHNHFGRA
jgi:hypothetical protein